MDPNKSRIEFFIMDSPKPEYFDMASETEQEDYDGIN